MHSPQVAATKRRRLEIQRLHGYFLRQICDLSPSTPHRILLVELGLLPLEVYGGSSPCSSGTAWLFCLWGPCITPFCWTILLKHFAIAPAMWLALWQLACD